MAKRIIENHCSARVVSRNKKSGIFSAYEHSYSQESRDIDRAIHTLEVAKTKNLQEKYQKFTTISHTVVYGK